MSDEAERRYAQSQNLQDLPFDTARFEQDLLDQIVEARTTKNYWALTEFMHAAAAGNQTNPHFIAGQAWAYIRMVASGVHIDDVANDARQARALIERAKPLFPDGKFPPRIGDLVGEIHVWLARAEAFEAEQSKASP
jgi:hypothetical protein